MTDEGRAALKAACIAICRTRRLIGPQGTCAAICMDQLGDAPARGCRHAVRVHGGLAQTAIRAYLAALPGWRLVPVIADVTMMENAVYGWPDQAWEAMIKKVPSPPGLEDSEHD